MVEKRESDLISLLEKALSAQPQEVLEEIGTVIKVGDNICKIYGLANAVYGELIEFEGGNRGIVLDLDEDYVSDSNIHYENKSDTPKLTPHKAINKFLLTLNLKVIGKVPVYFAWKKKQPDWIFLEDGAARPEKPYFTVDYNKKKGEWDIGYIISLEDRKFASIDDLTADVKIHQS